MSCSILHDNNLLATGKVDAEGGQAVAVFGRIKDVAQKFQNVEGGLVQALHVKEKTAALGRALQEPQVGHGGVSVSFEIFSGFRRLEEE